MLKYIVDSRYTKELHFLPHRKYKKKRKESANNGDNFKVPVYDIKLVKLFFFAHSKNSFNSYK